MTSSPTQRGGAIIIAILTVALVTASATFLIRSQSLWVSQTTTAFFFAQGQQILLAGLDWSMAVLADDAQNSSIDHPQELWATRLPPSQTEEWEIVGAIDDAQGRFNLNNLVQNGVASPTDIDIFARLLRQIGADPNLASVLTDWMDSDSELTAPGSAEDDFYLKSSPPYRAANQPLTELSNLLRVRGFDANIIARLEPFVTVLPKRTAVNINTAPPLLFTALIPGLSLGEAEILAKGRDTTPFHSLDELQSRLPNEQLKFGIRDLCVGSQYFQVTGTAKNGETKMGLTSLVHREGRSKPAIVWRREF